MLDDVLTARIEAAKAWLLAGGLLQEVEWGVPVGERDERGRITYAYSEIDAFVEQLHELDRGAASTERADNIVLHILDPVAIFDDQLFRFGDPIHVYGIKEINGLLSDEEAGTRYQSEVVLIR